MTDETLDALSPDGLGFVLADGSVLAANAPLRALLCAAPGLLDLPLPAGDRAELAARLAASEASSVVVVADQGPRRRWLHVRLHPAGDGRRGVVVRDDTARIEAEAEIRRLERLSVVANLARGLVHDLANWLSPLAAVLDLAALQAPPAGQRELLAGARQGLERATAVAQRLSQMLRTGAEHRQRVALRSLAQEGIDLAQRALATSGHRLESDVPAELPDVHVAPSEATYALLALLLLARDTSPPGSIVRLSARAERAPAPPGRAFGVLEIEDRGDPAVAEALTEALREGRAPRELAAGHDLPGLMLTLLALHRDGALVRAIGAAAGRTFTLALPAARSR